MRKFSYRKLAILLALVVALVTVAAVGAGSTWSGAPSAGWSWGSDSAPADDAFLT